MGLIVFYAEVPKPRYTYFKGTYYMIQIIGVILPFLASAAMIYLGSYVERFARKYVSNVEGGVSAYSEEIIDLCCRTAFRTYFHLSFVTSLVVSVASCVGASLSSCYPVIGAVGAVVVVIVLFPTWVLLWQNAPFEGAGKGVVKQMTIASWVTWFILLVASVSATMYKAP